MGGCLQVNMANCRLIEQDEKKKKPTANKQFCPLLRKINIFVEKNPKNPQTKTNPSETVLNG